MGKSSTLDIDRGYSHNNIMGNNDMSPEFINAQEGEKKIKKPFVTARGRVFAPWEIDDLKSRLDHVFDYLDAIRGSFSVRNGNGEARSQAFTKDASTALIKDVVELGNPITDTNKDAGAETKPPESTETQQ